MTVQMYHSREQLSERDIVNTESQLGFTLPGAYRIFLLRNNGGRPQPNAFPVYNNPADTHGLVQAFLCIKEGDIYNLGTYVRRYRDRVPSGFLPIAVDPGGNLICLATSGVRTGKVYFWDHEEEANEGETPGYNNTYLIANSFDEFLNSLTLLK